MGFAIHGTVQHAAASASGTGSGGDTDVTITVSAGDLVVAWCKHEGLNTDGSTISVARSAGGDAFTPGTVTNHTNTDLRGQFFYLIGPTNTGSQTYRMSISVAKPFRSFHVWCFTPDAGESVTLDSQNTGQGNSGSPLASGAIDTHGTDEVVLGGWGEYIGDVATSATINGVADDGHYFANGDPNFTASWYKILTATFTGGTATVSHASGTSDYIVNIIAFQSAAGGATPKTATETVGAGMTDAAGAVRAL